ncbi:type I restriction endonuclease [Belnapia rosea]|uniref:type I restriction endonuclease n=1 Tax=Belnapia rosea TaxID=938405 RepID=UPI0015A364E7|nr:type I restriction endonuclease [Belnapia rosea]
MIGFMSSASPYSSSAGAGLAVSALRQIADRIPGLRQQGARISEQDTKRVLITPAVQALGWDILDIEEVRNEYRHNAGHNPVDYALFLNRSPVLFVEAKPLAQSLDDTRWMLQTLSYAHGAGVDWCALTNGVEWRIYKVLAQGEADRKLFATVTIDGPEGLDEAARVLGLLSRDNMRSRAIDDLWQAWHVDRQVKEVLEQVLEDEAFAGLIRKRAVNLSLAEIRKSLRRAKIAVSYPNIFAGIVPRPQVSAQAPEKVPQTERRAPEHVEGVATGLANGAASAAPRRRLQSTDDLVALGRLPVGTTLIIRGREGSAAKVLDGRTVEFKGQRLSFNEWGQRITGWPSIRIYTMACLPDGRTLDQLRDQSEPNSQTS